MSKKNIKLFFRVFLFVFILQFFPGHGYAQDNSVVAPDSRGGPGKPDSVIDVLDLKEMDVLDVFKLISIKSGLNIVAGKNVRGLITVFLRDIKAREALNIIVDSYGWAYQQEGNVVNVMTQQEYKNKFGYEFGKKIETRVMRLSFENYEGLKSSLEKLKNPAGKIIIDEKTGVLMLEDEVDALNKMEKIIQQMDVATETAVFDISYAQSEDLSEKIGDLLTPEIGTVKFDERSNKIVVTDLPKKIKKIKDIVSAFDQKDKEALIQAKVIQITLSDDYKLGVNWEALVSDYHTLDLKSSFDILGSSDKRGTLSIGTVEGDEYTFLVQALNEIGDSNILSSPRITVVNNKEAKILVGSSEPYVTSTTTTPATGATTTAESVNFIEVGVKLFVTPMIHNDGFITMDIKPEVSSVTSTITTSNNNTIPIVETSQAETTVLVKDGVTIVIGGLIKEEKISTTKRVPFLGKIPLLGAAFRSHSDSSSKTEIVIFLTPKIISGDVDEKSEGP